MASILRALPLVERKAALRALLPVSGALRYSEHFEEQGEAMFDEAERMGLEGIIGKRAASPYVSKRSADWIKINAAKSDDFVVVGYLPPKQGGKGFGALLLAQYRDGVLTYAGRAGSGFAARDFAVLEPLLAGKPARGAAGRGRARARRGLARRRPRRAGEVQAAHARRHAAPARVLAPARRQESRRLRLAERGEADAPAEGHAAEPAPTPDEPPERPAVAFTNLDKVFWPADGYTKGDMIAYYEGIAEWLLPYLKDRPVVLTRYPDGIDGKSFFQKDAPVYAPSWLRLETMWSEHAEREIRYFVLDDVESLLYVANMGTIPLHVWSSRVAALERPDWCILDLDPKGAPLKHVVEIARHMHALCEDVGLTNFVKTSGSTGLHVLIPLGARYTYEQSRTLAELLARFTAKSLPDDRDDRSLRLRPRRQGLSRLSAERPRAVARVAVLRAAAAGCAGVDAARVAVDQRPAEARALQHPLGAQVAAEARRPAGRRARRSRPTCWPRSSR